MTNNTVTVYVWKPIRNSVGHVALKTTVNNLDGSSDETYMSFWPEPTNSQYRGGAGPFHGSYAVDVTYEKRDADWEEEIDFLDVDAINQAFTSAKNNPQHYNFKNYNCANFAFEMLKAGKILDYLPSSSPSFLTFLRNKINNTDPRSIWLYLRGDFLPRSPIAISSIIEVAKSFPQGQPFNVTDGLYEYAYSQSVAKIIATGCNNPSSQNIALSGNAVMDFHKKVKDHNYQEAGRVLYEMYQDGNNDRNIDNLITQYKSLPRIFDIAYGLKCFMEDPVNQLNQQEKDAIKVFIEKKLPEIVFQLIFEGGQHFFRIKNKALKNHLEIGGERWWNSSSKHVICDDPDKKTAPEFEITLVAPDQICPKSFDNKTVGFTISEKQSHKYLFRKSEFATIATEINPTATAVDRNAVWKIALQDNKNAVIFSYERHAPNSMRLHPTLIKIPLFDDTKKILTSLHYGLNTSSIDDKHYKWRLKKNSSNSVAAMFNNPQPATPRQFSNVSPQLVSSKTSSNRNSFHSNSSATTQEQTVIEEVQQRSLQELPLSEQANRGVTQEINDELLQKGVQASLRPS